MRDTQSQEETGSRRRRTRSEVEAILEEYGRSGLTQRVFTRRVGIGVSTLQYWLRRARQGSRGEGTERKSKRRPAPELSLLEVKVAGSGPGFPVAQRQGYEIELKAGSRLRVPGGFEEAEVRRLLQLLKEVG